MKKYLIILLLLTGVFLQTQLFSYSGNIIGDTKCSEINESTRYSNLSPTIISKIDLIGDRINEKYKEKDNIYKEKIYNLFEKVLNEHLQKTTYSGVQKEVLLRIGDYFVCKKENLNITQESLEIHNLQISNITDHGVKVTWEGNPNAQTWLYVKKTGSTGQKNDASNNVFEYNNLGADYEFTLSVQGLGGDTIKEVDFKTLSNNTASEDIIINSEDTTNTTTGNTINPSKNKYLEEVILPKCDVNNSEVQFIKTNDDWKHINDSNKSIFCVSPGDYSGLKNIILTRSGTKDKRRYIVLNNGNDLHPGKLDIKELANYSLSFNNASYWVLDRPSATNLANIPAIFHFINGSSNNIINRMFAKDYYNAFTIEHLCHRNTIQNSRFDTMTYQSFASDSSTIQIVDWEHNDFTVHGTKIVNNEFVDCKPGRIARSPNSTNRPEGFAGTIFDSNNVEFTSRLYTDCNGNIAPDGYCYRGEAVGFTAKAGSDDINNPVIFSNNHVWGHRETDPTLSNLSGAGKGFSVYIGAHYVHVKNNVIFNGTQGIVLSDKYKYPYGTQYCEVTGNIIVDCGREGSSFNLSQAYHANVKNNIIKDAIGDNVRIWYNFAGNHFGKNIFINSGTSIDRYQNNKSLVEGIDTNIFYSTAAEGGYTKDYSFTTDKFTNNPRTIILENVLKAD